MWLDMSGSLLWIVNSVLGYICEGTNRNSKFVTQIALVVLS